MLICSSADYQFLQTVFVGVTESPEQRSLHHGRVLVLDQCRLLPYPAMLHSLHEHPGKIMRRASFVKVESVHVKPSVIYQRYG